MGVALAGAVALYPKRSHVVCAQPSAAPQIEAQKREIFRLAAQRRLVPFLGAGSTRDIYCDWQQLVDSLWARGLVELRHGQLGAKSESSMANVDRLTAFFGPEWVATEIRQLFDMKVNEQRGHVSRQDWLRPQLELQRRLGDSGFPFVVTTNFDTSLVESQGNFSRPLFRRGLPLLSALLGGGEQTMLVKIQGDVTRDGASELIMGYSYDRDAYRASLEPLREQLASRGVVFWGASLRSGNNWEDILEAVFRPVGTEEVPLRCRVTADSASPHELELEKKLWDEYRIATLRLRANNWEAVDKLIGDLCGAARSGQIPASAM